jgi:membrane-bound lytic murein transglycosylase D
VRVALDGWSIARILSSSQVLRTRACLRILVSETVTAPFSFWIPGRYYIAVPAALIWQPAHLRLVMRHEAQHHRQGDTKVLYLCQLLRGLFYWNPAAHLLTRQVLELQEFACDEAVIARGPTSARDYCRCLLSIAESIAQQRDGVLRAGMVTRNRGSLLRRMETALARPPAHLRKTKVMLTGTVAITLLTAFSIAFARPIQDRRISRAEAERMTLVAQQSATFPIAMNDRVLAQLNVLLGTPDGRAYLKAGIARMEQYKPLIAAEIERNGLPAELIAVPLVESGYRNLPADEFPRHGAGLWMFIEPTAKRFGLEVSDTKDERLDVPSETAAALRMLSSLYQRFDDWSLALLAYNIGHARIEQGIRETGSHDAWELIRRGYENDPDYLSRSVAVMLILKNPDVL